MAKIADDFQGSVFIDGHGFFRAGDDLPADVTLGEHIPTVEPRRAARRAKGDAED